MSGDNPAFPAESYVTADGGRRPVQYSGMNQRAYFAAHAPEVPADYARLQHQRVVDEPILGPGGKRVAMVYEPELARIVRWRLEYADAMLKALK